MLLSMSMIANYLKKYNPECCITEDAMTIQGLRFLNDEQHMLQPEYVYVSTGEQFFSARQLQGSYLIVSGKSRILCANCDYEELLNDLLGAFEYYLKWEQRLLDAASHHAPLRDMLAIASTVINAPFFVSNEDGTQVIADYYPPDFSLDAHWSYIRENKAISPQTILMPLFDKTQYLSDFGSQPKLVTGPSGEIYIGQYLIQDGERIAFFSIYVPDASAAQLLQQLSDAMAGYLILAEEFSTCEARIRSSTSLLNGLLSGEHIEDAALKRFCGKAPAAPWRLLLVYNPFGENTPRKRALLQYLQLQRDYCIPILGENLYVLVSCQSLSRFIREFQANPGCSGLLIGASCPFFDLYSLPTRRQQARFALDEAHKKSGLFLCEEYAFDFLLRTLAKEAMTPELLHPALEQLEQYDKENNMELLRTLYAYLRNERKLLGTAEELNIHRNTLKYRLRRISELTDIDFVNDYDRDFLTLSCRLKEVLR